MKRRILITFVALCMVISMLTLSSCELLDRILGSEDPHEHSFGEWEVSQEPTCIKNGKKIRFCECGETESEDIPAGHDYDVTYTCKVCGYHSDEVMTFTLLDDDTYQVGSADVSKLPKELTIPSHYKGKPVTTIAYSGFEYGSNLEKVTLPNTITTIMGCGFRSCKNLTEINLPDSLTKMEDSALSGCTSLAKITIPKNLTTLNKGVFASTAITEMHVPDNIKIIDDHAFSGCKQLTTITLPDTLERVGAGIVDATAYYKDQSNWGEHFLYIGNHLIAARNTLIIDLVIPEGTVSIAGKVFYERDELRTVTLPDSLTSIGSEAFFGCFGIDSFKFGNGLKYVYSHAFKSVRLGNIVLSESIEIIGSSAFYGAFVDTVMLPDKVIEIGSNAFAYTSFWNQRDLRENGILYAGKHVIAATRNINVSQSAAGECVIKEGTLTIANGAFSKNKEITGITIPDSVKRIGSYAFSECTNLEYARLPESGVEFFGERMFGDCENLREVNIPVGITAIGDYTFNGCHALESIVIPEGVVSIGDLAFNGCNSLKTLSLPSTLTAIGKPGTTVFAGCAKSLESITVSEGNPVYYSQDNCLMVRATKKLILGCKNSIIPSDTLIIGKYAFSGCDGLTELILPEGLTTIDLLAFNSCSNLTSVYIPASVTYICAYAFDGCDNLKSAVFADPANWKSTSLTSPGTYYGTLSESEIAYPEQAAFMLRHYRKDSIWVKFDK